MDFKYVLALHIVFMVCWFAGLFYIVRLFIYQVEANEKTEVEKNILIPQYQLMQKRLWYGITWPSAILTLAFGASVMINGHWYTTLLQPEGRWLLIKLVFVLFLYLYFFTLHNIFRQQLQGIFKYTSQKLRIWNEVATVFLIAIVMLAVVKQSMSFVWGLTGLVLFVFVLLSAIRIYKLIRTKRS